MKIEEILKKNSINFFINLKKDYIVCDLNKYVCTLYKNKNNVWCFNMFYASSEINYSTMKKQFKLEDFDFEYYTNKNNPHVIQALQDILAEHFSINIDTTNKYNINDFINEDNWTSELHYLSYEFIDINHKKIKIEKKENIIPYFLEIKECSNEDNLELRSDSDFILSALIQECFIILD